MKAFRSNPDFKDWFHKTFKPSVKGVAREAIQISLRPISWTHLTNGMTSADLGENELHSVIRIPTESMAKQDEESLLTLLKSICPDVEMRQKPPGSRRIVGTLSRDPQWEQHLAAMANLCALLPKQRRSPRWPVEIDVAVNPEDYKGRIYLSLALDRKTMIALTQACEYFVFSVYPDA